MSEQAGTRVITLGRSQPPADTERENVCHEVGDVTDASFLDDLFRRHCITHIVHAAGVRTRECENNPRLAFEGNVLGTERLLRSAERCASVLKFIHFSTAAIYGRRGECLDETAQVAAGSVYAISKAASELVLPPSPDRPRSFATINLRPGFVLAPAGEGSLASLIRTAARSGHVTGTLPEHFPLHWAPDLAETVARLLERDTGRHRVLHPPGCNTGAEEFARCLKEAVERRGRQPLIEIQADPDAPFPAGLVDRACRDLIGPMELTPLSDMIDRFLSVDSASAIKP